MNDSPPVADDTLRIPQHHQDISSFAEYLNDGLYVSDPETILVYANTGLAKILGYESPGEVIGNSFLDFVDPDNVKEMRQKYHTYLCSGSPSSLITTKIVRKDGSTGVIEINPASAEPQGYSQGVVRDITEVRKTEQQLRKTESLYQSVVRLSPDAIVLSTLKGLIIDFNIKAQKLFNYGHEKQVGSLSIWSFIHPDEQARMDSLLIDAANNREQLDVEITLVRTDGSKFLGEISVKKVEALNGDKPFLTILARDITKRKAMEEQLKAMSVTDPLTELFNRRGFTIAAEQELRHAKRTKAHATVLFMDMNGMKAINDTYGHDMGDQVLLSVANMMRETFRDSDIIGRTGGDEFVVFAVNTHIETANAMVIRMKEKLKSGDFPFDVSLACGAAAYDRDTDPSLAQLIKQADLAMYQDKIKMKLS